MKEGRGISRLFHKKTFETHTHLSCGRVVQQQFEWDQVQAPP